MASRTETAVSVPAFPWWIVLVEGIFALIFGIFLITAPGATSLFLVTVLGFYWLIRGIFSIIEIFIPKMGLSQCVYILLFEIRDNALNPIQVYCSSASTEYIAGLM